MSTNGSRLVVRYGGCKVTGEAPLAPIVIPSAEGMSFQSLADMCTGRGWVPRRWAKDTTQYSQLQHTYRFLLEVPPFPPILVGSASPSSLRCSTRSTMMVMDTIRRAMVAVAPTRGRLDMPMAMGWTILAVPLILEIPLATPHYELAAAATIIITASTFSAFGSFTCSRTTAPSPIALCNSRLYTPTNGYCPASHSFVSVVKKPASDDLVSAAFGDAATPSANLNDDALSHDDTFNELNSDEDACSHRQLTTVGGLSNGSSIRGDDDDDDEVNTVYDDVISSTSCTEDDTDVSFDVLLRDPSRFDNPSTQLPRSLLRVPQSQTIAITREALGRLGLGHLSIRNEH